MGLKNDLRFFESSNWIWKQRIVKKLRQNQNKLRIFVVICKTLMSLHIIMSCWLHYSKLCKETKKCDKIASNNNTQLASFFQACFASQSRYNRGCFSPTWIFNFGPYGQLKTVRGKSFNHELWATFELFFHVLVGKNLISIF